MDVRGRVVLGHGQLRIEAQGPATLASATFAELASTVDQRRQLTLGGIDDRLPQQFLAAPLHGAPKLVVRILGHRMPHFVLVLWTAAML